MIFAKQLVTLLTLSLAWGCSESGFKGGSAKKEKSPPKNSTLVVKGPDDQTVSDFDWDRDKGGKLNFEFDPGDQDVQEEITVRRNLAIYFAIDVTGSMKSNIDVVKNSVNEFATALRERGFKPRLGVVPFRDDLLPVLPLTENLTEFQNFVGNLQATGGADPNEAAVLAVTDAMRRLDSDAGKTDVKTALVITDNPGHSGGGTSSGPVIIPPISNRDCSIDGLVNRLNSIGSNAQRFYKIYHSTTNRSRANCSGFSSAEQQWERVLSNGLSRIDRAERGGRLPFPLTREIVTTDFVRLIEETTEKIDQVCLARQAEVVIDGRQLATWKATSLNDVYRRYKARKKIDWKDALTEEAAAPYRGREADLKIIRCCADREDVEASRFDACEDKTQQVKFPL